MRLFLAVNLPSEVRDAIDRDNAEVREAIAREEGASGGRLAGALRWVPAASLHATLKFIGEYADDRVSGVAEAIAPAVAAHPSFAVETTHMGAFPNFRRPRVVWVGMTAEFRMRQLAADIDRALAPLRIPVEARPFQAHLTVARVRGEIGTADAALLARAAGRERPRREFALRTVDLMRSELGPGGSRYSLIAAVPLHARGS